MKKAILKLYVRKLYFIFAARQKKIFMTSHLCLDIEDGWA